jgi:hypothetical protein
MRELVADATADACSGLIEMQRVFASWRRRGGD